MSIYRNLYLRFLVLAAADATIVLVGYFFAYWLRLDVLSMEFGRFEPIFLKSLPWLIAIRFICGIVTRQYFWSFQQASLNDAFSVGLGVFGGSIIFIMINVFGNIDVIHPPKTVYFLEFASTLMGMEMIRFLPRYVQYIIQRGKPHFFPGNDTRMKTIIYGAGHTGQLLLRDILHNGDYPYKVIGFIDDDPATNGTRILGVPVLGKTENLPEIIDRHQVEKILIAIAKLSPERLRELVSKCIGRHVRFKKIPSYNDIVRNGSQPVSLNDLRLEDLLRRDEITFDHSMLAEYFVGKTVLVTGAAGSIGTEICRQVSMLGIKKLVALDINENNLYFLNMDISDLNPELDFSIAFGSVRDPGRLKVLFQQYKPDIVFHAAAHKHVPMMEDCPCEALANNVMGTLNVAECANECGVERFVLISTDKAVRPTNVMGASKYLAEVVLRKFQKKSRTHFMAVRFGNVLGSSGSLIPILQRQIKKGGPVTITHPKITRYFMTIPEAVGLVIIASVQNEGGTCVLDMGEPVLIEDVVRNLITLNGMVPDVDIPIKYIGLRPGEKMYEELFLAEEQLNKSSHPRIMLAHPLEYPQSLEDIKTEISAIVEKQNHAAACNFIHKCVPGSNLQPCTSQPS